LKSEGSIADLNERFGIAGVASVVAGGGGLPKVLITSPQAKGEMYLHGGHVTSWTPGGTADVFYCSPNTVWRDGKAIRGGVPVCFPWFGDKVDKPSAPAHGFVRTKSWELVSIEKQDDGIAVTTETASGDDTVKWWPHEFRLVCRATFGSELTLAITVTNTGSASLSIEEALHAYFHVGDSEAVAVQGLDGTRYIDKVDHFIEKLQTGDVRFSGETDRVYLGTSHDLVGVDPVLNRRISIRKQSSDNTVVWNPWAEKAAAMSDLGSGEWKKFVCVETANVGKAAVEVAPGQSHTMSLHIRVY
jgi:glucose-6-phosphate 1-epimerase